MMTVAEAARAFQMPALQDIFAESNQPSELRGVLSRLATHNTMSHCLAAVTQNGLRSKLMRITRENYERLLFGGIMRRRVVCQRGPDAIWTIEPEA